MNRPKNAALTPIGRALLISRIHEQGWTITAAAEAAGVSRRTAYKWLALCRGGLGWPARPQLEASPKSRGLLEFGGCQLRGAPAPSVAPVARRRGLWP